MSDRRALAGLAALAVLIVLGGPMARAEGGSATPADAAPEAPEESGLAEALDDDEGADLAESLEESDPLFPDAGEGERWDVPVDHDPYEPANRVIFLFNDTVDQWILSPVTEVYQFLVPGPVRRGINRVVLNLNAPIIFSNQVLQLRPRDAGRTLVRFVMNSSLGLVGFYDFAEDVMALPRIEADFGQTLYRYGIPRGPYLVVPLIGPSTARDAVGTIVDQTLTPVFYLIGPLNLTWQIAVGGGQGFAIREQHDDSLEALREGSVDFYSALRSSYLQSRRAKEDAVGRLCVGDRD